MREWGYTGARIPFLFPAFSTTLCAYCTKVYDKTVWSKTWEDIAIVPCYSIDSVSWINTRFSLSMKLAILNQSCLIPHTWPQRLFPDLPVHIIPEPGACLHLWPVSNAVTYTLIVLPPPQPAALIESNCLHKDIYHYTEYVTHTQEYVSSYHAELAVISQRWEQERRGEERWYDNWRTAVRKIKELYA